MRSPFPDSIAIQWNHTAGEFVESKCRDLSWAVQDAGTLYGAILVERFRSYGHRLPPLADYRARLEKGARAFGIHLNAIPFDLHENAERLLMLNRPLVNQLGDVSVVVLLSPGIASGNGEFGTQPTLMMHVSPIPFLKLHCWYKQGTDLVLGSQQVVPSVCWPSDIKSRSRLPYFLSDVARSAGNSDQVLPVLTTTSGCIADTSVANVLVVTEKRQILSPRKEDILVGCTLSALERLLIEENIPIQYRDVSPDMLRNAMEVILTGSSGGVWFARSFDGRVIGAEAEQSVAMRAIELWKEYVGIDYIGQAAMFS